MWSFFFQMALLIFGRILIGQTIFVVMHSGPIPVAVFLLIDVDLFLDDYIICQIYLQLLEIGCNFMLF